MTDYSKSRFDSAITEAIHCDSLNGCFSATGHVDSPVGYVCLAVYDHDTIVDTSIDGDGTETVTVPAGAYLLFEDQQGFVVSALYDSVDVARSTFDAIESQYGVWCGDDDE